jgi:hypothetical protein
MQKLNLTSLKLSPEQELIVNTKEDTIVNAPAGGGKTHTLLEYCKAQKGRGIYVAYNAAIANEVRAKISPNTEVTTSHSLAYRYWRKKGFFHIGNLNNKHLENYFEPSLCKSQFVNSIKFSLERFCSSDLTAEEYFEDHAFYEAPQGGIKALLEDLRAFKLPVTHDMYLKFYSDLKLNLGYSYFVVDEVQDLNLSQKNIVDSQSCPRILVGDSMQSIYSFRNCINGFDVFDYKPLFLTTSYRNNEEVVNIVNYISSYSSYFGAYTKPIDGKGFKRNDTECFIGQTNYFVFSKKIEVPEITIVGEYDWDSIFAKLKDLYFLDTNQKSKITNKFLTYFRDLGHFYVDCENKKDFDWIGLMKLAKEGIGQINKLRDAVNTKSNPNLYVSNVHKSKGLEWNKVTLDESFLSPDEICATKNSEYNNREELNKLYVAASRAMTELVLPKDFTLSTYSNLWKKN